MVEAVRSRIDLKYLLGLKLGDPGFDGSLLSDFRQRSLEGGAAEQLLNEMLLVFQKRGWLKAGGKQRRDSTMVLAATRALNRLELVGETMRQALEGLAVVAPLAAGSVAGRVVYRYRHCFDQCLPFGKHATLLAPRFPLLRALRGKTSSLPRAGKTKIPPFRRM
jgi:hypothetical protein